MNLPIGLLFTSSLMAWVMGSSGGSDHGIATGLLAQGYYGLALCYCGRWEEGDVAAHRALRLSPRDPCSAIYCGIAAYAQFVGGNYDEAIRLAREGIRQRGDFVGAHRVLTAAAGMAGQGDIAKVTLQELCRAQPNICLAWIERQMPMKREADREHYLEGFRRAGLGQLRPSARRKRYHGPLVCR
jgi:tetratricopeptide (TPR) repeat protein